MEAAKGMKERYTSFACEALIDPTEQPPLSRTILREALPGVNWDTQVSGISIGPDDADALERLWAQHLAGLGYELPEEEELLPSLLPEEPNSSEELVEGATTTITVNAYERNPQARQACIDRYGMECCICDKSLDQRYGEIGRDVVHIHHLKPLSQIGESYVVDPIRDLRPICPNCHAIVHSEREPLSIESVKSALEARRTGTPT